MAVNSTWQIHVQEHIWFKIVYCFLLSDEFNTLILLSKHNPADCEAHCAGLLATSMSPLLIATVCPSVCETYVYVTSSHRYRVSVRLWNVRICHLFSSLPCVRPSAEHTYMSPLLIATVCPSVCETYVYVTSSHRHRVSVRLRNVRICHLFSLLPYVRPSVKRTYMSPLLIATVCPSVCETYVYVTSSHRYRMSVRL